MQPINSKQRNKRAFCRAVTVVFFTLVCGAAMTGCSYTATIIDRSDTKTTVENPRLENEPFLRVLLGGAVREVPLRDIRMAKIDPTEQMNFERQQFFAAQVILRDGSVLSDAGSDSGMDRRCYIAVQNVLVGRQHKTVVRIPLSNVQQIKVDK